MGTLFVLDRSWSMKRFLPGTSAGSTNGLMMRVEKQETVLKKLLRCIKNEAAREYVSIMCFCNQTEVLPFTNEHDKLLADLASIPCRGRFVLASALHDACVHLEMLQSLPFPINAVKIVVLTGSMSPDDALIQVPFSTWLMTLSNECCDQMPTSKSVIIRGGSKKISLIQMQICDTLTETDAEADRVFRDIFDPYIGVVYFGHMKICISLYPNALSKPSGTASDDHIPSALSILGFIPLNQLRNPPCMAEYDILQGVFIPDLLPRRVVNPEVICESDVLYSAELLMLYQSLCDICVGALIYLKENWYGLIIGVGEPQGNTIPHLKLYVLHKNTELPWMGSFDCLQKKKGTEKVIHPPQMQYVKSYNMGKDQSSMMFGLNEESLKTEIKRLILKIKDLPRKKDVFLSELERIQRCAQNYQSRETTLLLISVLSKEKDGQVFFVFYLFLVQKNYEIALYCAANYMYISFQVLSKKKRERLKQKNELHV